MALYYNATTGERYKPSKMKTGIMFNPTSALGMATPAIAGKQARKTAKYVGENKYQWMTSSLKQAGLNPSLAYSSPGVSMMPQEKNKEHSALKKALALKIILDKN